MTVEAALSPRMRALWDEYSRRGAGAVEAFWREIETAGTPLIEALDGDAEHSAVTFVWRLDEPGQEVGLVHGPLGVGELDRLDHLGTSDLAFRTYRVANDLRNAYWFMPDPVRSLDARSAEEWTALNERRAEGRFLVPDPLNRRTRPHLADPLDPETEEPGHSVLEMPAHRNRRLTRRTSSLRSESRRTGSNRAGSRRLGGCGCTSRRSRRRPMGYDVLIAFDGHRALDELRLPAILDGLHAAGRIRPTIAVFVESLFDWRQIELACHEPFTEFPRARADAVAGSAALDQ